MTFEELKNSGKKVKMNLVSRDGNALYLMGAFQIKAEEQGWTEEEIEVVMAECRSSDYNHLLRTLMAVTK